MACYTFTTSMDVLYFSSDYFVDIQSFTTTLLTQANVLSLCWNNDRVQAAKLYLKSL